MTKKMFCLSSMADGEEILNNGTSSYETPRSLAVLTHTNGRASKTDPPDSSGSPALSCTCNVCVAYERYSQGSDHDPAYYYRKCELHEKDKKAPWLVSTLEELDDAARYAPLTAEGQAFRRELLAMKGGGI